MRTKLIPIIAVAFVFSVVVVLPQIIEAKRDGQSLNNSQNSLASAFVNPVQGNSQRIEHGASVRNDTSIPLREMKQKPIDFGPEREAALNPKIRHFHEDKPDKNVQTQITGPDFNTPNMPTTDKNFNGIPFPGVACNCAPPDTNGEVGATQYVQIVNEGYQVFDKTTGASLLGPASIASVWGGFGGVCETAGHGDPVMLYDQLAGRWLISQFAGSGVPTDECIAVST